MMQAKDVMTSRVVTIRPEATIPEVVERLLSHRISALPVVDKRGRLQGIVSEGDLIGRVRDRSDPRSWWLRLLADRDTSADVYVKSRGTTAGDVMTREVVTVGERTPIGKIAALLELHHIKRVPVLRGGKVVGIVSRANLLQGLATRSGGGAARPSDRRLRVALLKEVDRADIDRLYVNVVVSAGTVELWGFVASAAQKRALAVSVRNVPGVKRVTDRTSVLTPAIQGSMGAQ
jgi:CBS domain-containing protein